MSAVAMWCVAALPAGEPEPEDREDDAEEEGNSGIFA